MMSTGLLCLSDRFFMSADRGCRCLGLQRFPFLHRTSPRQAEGVIHQRHNIDPRYATGICRKLILSPDGRNQLNPS
jgi:hypothetical protein